MTPPNCTIVYDSVNFTVIRDNMGILWLSSGRKYVACYDKGLNKVLCCKGLTDKEKSHIGIFKKKLKNNEL